MSAGTLDRPQDVVVRTRREDRDALPLVRAPGRQGHRLANRRGPLVTSQEVGIEVLAQLRRIDDVSYLRFASVYKDFQELTDFERELGILLQKREASAKRAAASARARSKS